jgi:hypothetical protein
MPDGPGVEFYPPSRLITLCITSVGHQTVAKYPEFFWLFLDQPSSRANEAEFDFIACCGGKMRTNRRE